MGKKLKLMDGFYNLLKSFGTTKDPRTQSGYARPYDVTQQVANDLYVTNWLGQSVIDIPVDDAFREGRTITGLTPEQLERFEEEEKRLNTREVFSLAMKWAKVFGGSGIVIVMEGEDFETPLVIKNNTITNLIPLDKYHIKVLHVDKDLFSPNFNEPEYYQVSENGQTIHHSRVIRFQGMQPTIGEKRRNNSWGQSLYYKLYEPIMDSQQTSNSIMTMIYEAMVDVYKIEGLNKLLTQGQDAAVKNRLETAHKMKGIINGIALDANDEYDKKAATFAGLADIDDRAIQKVSGASGIPVTKLIGVAPAGMNSTGESDMNNYYDKVSTLQENELRPKQEYIDSIIGASMGIDVSKPITFEYKELKQVNEKELAEIENIRADRDLKYLAESIIQGSDVAANLVQNKTYASLSNEDVEQLVKEEGELDIEFEEGGIDGETEEKEENSAEGDKTTEKTENSGSKV